MVYDRYHGKAFRVAPARAGSPREYNSSIRLGE